MFGLSKKKESDKSLPWNEQAPAALQQAVDSAPVPKPLKGAMEKQLKDAAEKHAKDAGHQEVTAEDLMNGLLAKLPANMKSKVEQAMQQGPAGLKNLENELKSKQ